MDSDGPVPLETGGALNVRYRGRLLYSERGPASLPQRSALACETGPERLYLVLSPCLWYGVKELLSRIEPGSAILCLEADPELARLSREALPPELASDRRLAFLPSGEPRKVIEAATKLGRFRRCIPLRLSGGEAFNHEAYARVAALLQAEFAASWRSKAALLSMGRLWARNIFHNLASLAELDPKPLPSFPGPVIVCGAGPSLEAALPFIAENRSGLSVVVCDTALGSLIDFGIEPDLVVCLEGQAHNLPDFVPAGRRAIPLLADLSSHPATFRALTGKKHLTAVEIAPSPFLRRVGAIGLPALACPPLGSVGVHAVHVARRLTTAPVLITGLDFSSELGKTHARGSPSLRAELSSLSRLSRWPNQLAAAFRPGARPGPEAQGPLWPAGSLPRTDPALSAYAALLADELSRPGTAVFDLRGRGLPLGAPYLPFGEAARLIKGYGLRPTPEDGALCDSALCDAMGGSAARREDLGPRALGFIAEERARLDTMLEIMKGRRRAEGQELRRLAAESDYLLWPLPDDDRLAGMPQDLANRLLVEVDYWRWKLEEITRGK